MKKLTVTLDSKSIKNAIKAIEDYRLSLKARSETLVNRLLDEGIKVAYQHLGRYAGYVEFTKDVENDGTQCIGMLIGKDSAPYMSSWKVKDGIKTVEVSGLLMSEFGSGWLANVIWSVPGVGQGTFPGQTHAYDVHGWWWTTPDGVKHHSKGEEPHYPMYFADMTMLSQIDSIAREVFNDI